MFPGLYVTPLDETHGYPIRTGTMAIPSGQDPRPLHQDETQGHPIRAGPTTTPSGWDPRPPHQDETHGHPIRMRPTATPSGQDPQPPHQDGTHDHPIRAGPLCPVGGYTGQVTASGFGKWIQALEKELSQSPEIQYQFLFSSPKTLLFLSKPSN